MLTQQTFIIITNYPLFSQLKYDCFTTAVNCLMLEMNMQELNTCQATQDLLHLLYPALNNRQDKGNYDDGFIGSSDRLIITGLVGFMKNGDLWGFMARPRILFIPKNPHKSSFIPIDPH